MINQKSILIVLPQKEFSEKEFLEVYNYLKKNSINIFIASDAVNYCIGNNSFKVKNDISFYNINENNFAGIVLIGGFGIQQYWDNDFLQKIIKKFYEKKKIIAAICGSVVLLAKAGVLSGCCATCYPENKMELIKLGIDFKDIPLVKVKNIITARDPNSSSEFAKTIFIEIMKY